jgi:hypothetical protein
VTEAHQHAGPMLTAALDAYDNGLCVVKAQADGSKRPIGEWKQYQSQRPSREQVVAWFANEHPGMGVICGAVSGDLEMFELEGRFCTEIGTKVFAEAMKAAGLELLLRRLVNGFMTVSPSDGRHFLYRCEGAVDGNTKLARRPATDDEIAERPDDHIKVLIETRGEGGFVVLPPSHGTVHPTGRAWVRKGGSFAAIPTITVEERDALFAVARSFDTMPATPPRQSAPVAQKATIAACVAASGESWMGATVAHLEATWSTRALLEHYGWTYSHDDRHGRQLMTRPGKDEGVSGSINERGRLCVFSTSTPFAAPGGRLTPTYDRLDIIATYEHGGDRVKAGRDIAERAGILTPPPTGATSAFTIPRHVDPATGEVDADTDVYGTEFWESRRTLEHIRQAARSRLVAPSSLLGAVLARIAAFTPPSTCLPATVGGTAPLSLIIALRGQSGDGKSASSAAADALIPNIPPGCRGPLPLGSGEGLVEQFLKNVDETDENGKKRTVKRQAYRGVLFNLDEGQALAEMASRKGSTIMQALRTVWSGGDAGQANASAETFRSLTPGSYHVGIVSLWQDKAASLLLADADGGTPQRFIWMPTNDPGAGRGWTWPGPLNWEPPAAIVVGGKVQPHPLGIDQTVADEIIDHRISKLRGDTTEDPLDAHRRLCKLKVAGCLAVLEGHTTIGPDDWELAERIMTVSDGVRAWVMAEARRAQDVADEVTAKRAAKRDIIAADTVATRALTNTARAAWRATNRAHEAGRKATKRDIHAAIASRDRGHVSTDDAIAEAERLAWITPVGDGEWALGKARPT